MDDPMPSGCEDGGRVDGRVVDEDQTDGGIDTTFLRFSRSFVSALLEYVLLSRKIESVDVKTVPVSRLPAEVCD